MIITEKEYSTWLKKRVNLARGENIKVGHRQAFNYVNSITRKLYNLTCIDNDFNIFKIDWEIDTYLNWFKGIKEYDLEEYIIVNKESHEQAMNAGLKVFGELLSLSIYKNDYTESKNSIIKCDSTIFAKQTSQKGKRLIDFFEYNYDIFNEINSHLIKNMPQKDITDFKRKEEIVLQKGGPETGAYNKIFFGAPGTGKSYNVNKKYNKENGYNVERTLFHPEYTYNDFIGYLIPKLNNNSQIIYEYNEGSFTRVLNNAINNPYEKHVLIIEEINRGNSASIFGDIFQLLDRKEDGSSEYPIYNRQILDQIEKPKEKVSIPPNMWIIATANTSDQNSFVMDTAFLRRWEMKHIEIDFNKGYINDWEFEEGFLPCTTWKEFGETINSFLKEHSEELMSEDKLLGQRFIKKTDLEKENFINKVFRYLWEDVVKLNRNLLFDSSVKSFSDLCEKLKNGTQVFNNEVLSKFKIEDITSEKDAS